MAANIKKTLDQGTITVTNVAAVKSAGDMIVVGELVCVHKKDQLASATNCPVFIKDVIVLYDKLSTDVVTEGALLYYDSTNDRLTITAGSWKIAGVAAAAAGSGVSTVQVILGERV